MKSREEIVVPMMIMWISLMIGIGVIIDRIDAVIRLLLQFIQ